VKHSEGPDVIGGFVNTLNDGSVEVPIIGITGPARDLVLNYRSKSDKPNPDRLGMWLEITGVSGDGFSYDMYLKSVDEAAEDDAVITIDDDLKIVVPAGSVDQIRGSTIDLSEAPGGGGLFVQNPQSPSPAVGGSAASAPPPEGPVAERVIEVLNRQINPAIASHGGHAELVAIEEDVAYLRLAGGCQGCGMASVTLSQGIEVAIRDNVPEVTKVVDVTDHAAGENPYFEASKK
tara:strand:+ start:3109 stop:3810 length:702 start_codon:yes stop_codon:yes gene_type:complete